MEVRWTALTNSQLGGWPLNTHEVQFKSNGGDWQDADPGQYQGGLSYFDKQHWLTPGPICYRVRAVTSSAATPGVKIHGEWSDEQCLAGRDQPVPANPSVEVISPVLQHRVSSVPSPMLRWQVAGYTLNGASYEPPSINPFGYQIRRRPADEANAAWTVIEHKLDKGATEYELPEAALPGRGETYEYEVRPYGEAGGYPSEPVRVSMVGTPRDWQHSKSDRPTPHLKGVLDNDFAIRLKHTVPSLELDRLADETAEEWQWYSTRLVRLFYDP